MWYSILEPVVTMIASIKLDHVEKLGSSVGLSHGIKQEFLNAGVPHFSLARTLQ